MSVVTVRATDDARQMLTELYIEALLVDKDLADQVWELWDAGLIPDDSAARHARPLVTFPVRPRLESPKGGVNPYPGQWVYAAII